MDTLQRRNITIEDSNIAKYLYEMGQLKRVKRSGWWTAGIRDPESIAEHSFRTAILGYIMASLDGADPIRNDLLARELYCKQAAQYSLLSGDRPLLIASLKGLGDTYYYGKRYIPALQAYQNTLQYADELSSLMKSKVYTSLGVAYAHVDQRQEALHYLGLALDTFPDHPEADPSFSYAEFDLSQMILWEGITHSTLGQPEKALDIFNRIEQPNIIIPERIRIEIINQRAKSAIVSGDMEQGAAYVEGGIIGAKTLGSQRRLNEAFENFKQMCVLWPHEQRVKQLGELFH